MLLLRQAHIPLRIESVSSFSLSFAYKLIGGSWWLTEDQLCVSKGVSQLQHPAELSH